MNDPEALLMDLARRTRAEVQDGLRPNERAYRSIRVRRGGAAIASLLSVVIVAAGIGYAPSLLGARTDADRDIAVGGAPWAEPIRQRANGRIAYTFVGGPTMQLRTMLPDGTREKVIPTPQGDPWAHSWSPDGSKIAVTIFPRGSGGDRSIWVMDPDGTDAVQVASADNVSEASWTPDGTHLVYAATLARITQIRMVAADGTGDRLIHEQRADETFAIFSARVSPDGTKILFDVGTDTGFNLFVMNVDGSGIRQLTDTGDDYDGAWSPDGTQIAFAREAIVDDGATSSIFVMDASGSDVRRLTPTEQGKTDLSPQWSPDGTKILYNGGVTGGPGAVVVMNPDGSDPVELVGNDVLGVSWQPRTPAE